MINKNDPLVAAIQKVMQSNQAERDAVATVNEKFGVTDRRALPRERQHEWDSAYNSILTEGINVPDVSYKKTEKNGNSERTIMTKDTKNVFSGGTRTYQNVDKSNDGSTLTTKIKSQDLGKNKELGGKNYNVSTSTAYKKVDEEALEEKSFAALAPPYDKATHKDKLVGAGVLKKHPTKPGKHVLAKEEKKMKGNDPCWDNYEMVGMKKGKGGKPVPNCVPVKEEGDPSKAIRGDVVTGGSSVTSVAPKEKSVQPSDQSALKKKIQGIMKEASLQEKITKSTPVKDVISDFVHSKNPKFSADTKKKRIKRALGAYYGKHPEESKKTVKEGFNDRHNSSVTASVSEQVVADQLNEYTPMGGSAPGIALRNKIKQVGQSQRFRPRGSPTSSVNVSSKGPVSQKPGINAATGSMNSTVDQRRAGYNITNVRDTAYGANPTAKKLGPASSTGGEGPPPVPVSRAASVASRPGPSFERTGRGGNPSLAKPTPSFEKTGRGGNPSLTAKSTAGKDKPGTGPGQGSGAPTGPQNVKMATQNTQGSYDNMSFSQAFAAARKQAGGASGKFKYKGKEYQTNVKGTGTATKPQEKYQAASKLKTVAPPTQTTTTNSVAGGQGIAALPSRPSSVGPKPSGAQVMTNPTQRAYDKNNPSYSGSGVSAPVRPSAGVGPNNAQVAAPAPKQKPTFGGPR